MTPRAFRLHERDNVATLLDDAPAGTVHVLGAGDGPREIIAREPVSHGHKLALSDIAADAMVVKFGADIGRATQAIAAGSWVHLHNLASGLDARSGSLDLHSGAPSDTGSAYA